jgi:hypothetical protein
MCESITTWSFRHEGLIQFAIRAYDRASALCAKTLIDSPAFTLQVERD